MTDYEAREKAATEYQDLCEANEGEFLKFENVKDKRCNRPDLHAFIVINDLSPSGKGRDIVGWSRHDVIALDVDIAVMVDNATEAQLIDLYRCGVRWDSEYDSLAMFT